MIYIHESHSCRQATGEAGVVAINTLSVYARKIIIPILFWFLYALIPAVAFI